MKINVYLTKFFEIHDNVEKCHKIPCVTFEMKRSLVSNLMNIQMKHNWSKKYRSMCFLSSFEYLKFDLKRVKLSILK